MRPVIGIFSVSAARPSSIGLLENIYRAAAHRD